MLRYFGRLQAQDFKVCGSAFRPPLQEMGFRGGFSSIRLSKPHLLFPLPHFHTFAFLLPLKAPPPVLFVQNLLPWPPTFSLPAFHLPPLSSPTSTLPPPTCHCSSQQRDPIVCRMLLSTGKDETNWNPTPNVEDHGT